MKGFTALRGLAAVLVLGGHCALFIPFGWVAVPFFFVLSGYLVTRSWERIVLRSNGFGGSLRSFFGRRVARILPLYWGYLLVLLFFSLFSGFFAGPFLSLFLGYFGWLRFFGGQDMSMWYSQFWSLSIQLQFYLVIPFFLYLVRGPWRVRALWFFVILAPVLRVGLWFAFGNSISWENFLSLVYSCPLTYLDAFALGVLAWVSPLGIRGLCRGMVFYSMLVFSLFWGISLWGNPGPLWGRSLGFLWMMGDWGQWIWGYSLLSFFFYFVVSAVGQGFVVPSLLDNVIFRYLGKISYGIYVFHLPVVILVLYAYGFRDFRLESIHLVPVGAFVWSLGFSVMLASVSYHFWEIRFSGRS